MLHLTTNATIIFAASAGDDTVAIVAAVTAAAVAATATVAAKNVSIIQFVYVRVHFLSTFNKNLSAIN